MQKKSQVMSRSTYSTGRAADLIGVGRRTALRYIKEGKLKASLLPSGTHYRIASEDLCEFLDSVGLLFDDTADLRVDVVYGRVSTKAQATRGDLERQIDSLKAYTANKNPKNLEVITDVGSGLNDHRRGLMSLMRRVEANEISRIFVMNRDRLTRFGWNYLKLICDSHGTELVVASSDVENKTESEELAEDIIAIIHSFSGRLYGMRSRLKTEIANMELPDEDDNRE